MHSWLYNNLLVVGALFFQLDSLRCSINQSLLLSVNELHEIHFEIRGFAGYLTHENLRTSLGISACNCLFIPLSSQPSYVYQCNIHVNTVTPGLSGLELSRNLIYPTINSATLTISMYTNLPHSNLCYPTS